jgi:hypothetical protein
MNTELKIVEMALMSRRKPERKGESGGVNEEEDRWRYL